MFPIRLRRASTALTAAACAAVLTGLLVSDAEAGNRKWKGGRGHRGHDHRTVVRVVERPVYRPHVSFSYNRPAPVWCSSATHVVYNGDPYWYHVGLGAYFGGVDVNVNIGNTPPRGFGYWDPECGEWFDNVRAYSTHCKRHDHRPTLRVVRYEDDRFERDCEFHDHDHERDWR